MSIDQALKAYAAMYKGPLLKSTINALINLFGIGIEFTELMDPDRNDGAGGG